MISVEEALACIADNMPRGGEETIPVTSSAGRILRLAIRAERAFPPFDRVMMDGIAVALSAWESGIRKFQIRGEAAAGKAKIKLTDMHTAIAVMTGAVMPDGAEIVIPREHFRIDHNTVEVDPQYDPPASRFIHRKGAEASAGEVLLHPGNIVDPHRLATAVSCGATEVTVSVMPRIVLVSTGDELVDPGQPIQAHQIRRSNIYALEAFLRGKGFSAISTLHLNDDPDLVEQALESVLEEADCLIFSGGISVGQHDYVPEALRKLGTVIHFRGVTQRPGKPLLFGTRGNTAVFGLPGNPVSTMVGARRYVHTALLHWSGAESEPIAKVTLGEDFHFPLPLTFFLSVRPTAFRGCVQPAPVANSGDFTALVGTSGFVEIPAASHRIKAGTELRYFDW